MRRVTQHQTICPWRITFYSTVLLITTNQIRGKLYELSRAHRANTSTQLTLGIYCRYVVCAPCWAKVTSLLDLFCLYDAENGERSTNCKCQFYECPCSAKSGEDQWRRFFTQRRGPPRPAPRQTSFRRLRMPRIDDVLSCTKIACHGLRDAKNQLHCVQRKPSWPLSIVYPVQRRMSSPLEVSRGGRMRVAL